MFTVVGWFYHLNVRVLFGLHPFLPNMISANSITIVFDIARMEVILRIRIKQFFSLKTTMINATHHIGFGHLIVKHWYIIVLFSIDLKCVYLNGFYLLTVISIFETRIHIFYSCPNIFLLSYILCLIL